MKIPRLTLASIKNSTYVRFLRLITRWHSEPPPPAAPGNAPAPAARRVVTPDGTALFLRPLTRDDRAALRTFFAALSARSRRQRLLGPRAALNEAELSWLLALHPGRHWSWVAETAGPERRIVGVAQGCRDATANGSAEVAVAVLDAFQGQGLGRLLLAVVAAEAAAAGLTRLHGYTLADNARILGYGRRRDASALPQTDGTVELHFAAARLAADLPPAAALGGPGRRCSATPDEPPTRLPLPEVS